MFDKNAYAHDPRAQFMNWSNMAHASFDYVADARGFGWDFAGEWREGEWVPRLGRMTPPETPGMLPGHPIGSKIPAAVREGYRLE